MSNLPAKEIRCKCGHSFTVDRKRDWCPKCGRTVYYDSKDAFYGKLNTIYMTCMVFLGFGLLVYLYFAMVSRM
jgi:acetone carboxylase gamma subunit